MRIPVYVSKDSAMRRLQYPGDSTSMHRFYQKLALADDTTVTILHIGDSHVQGGEITHTLRTRLSECFGASDRGFLFPYRATRSNSPADYRILTTGRWTASRILSQVPPVPVGLAGAAAITSDSAATLLVTLRERGRWSFDRLTVVGESSDSTVVPVVLIDSAQTIIYGEPCDNGWTFTFPQQIDSCLIRFTGLNHVRKAPVKTKNNPRPKPNYAPMDSLHHIIVRGIRTTGGRNGIVYSESGINGASVTSWLRTSEKFEQELSVLHPDLVVCALATNDANVPPSQFDTAVYKANYRQLIDRLRTVNPDVSLLFLTGNDCWISIRNMRRQPNPNTPKAQAAIRALAQEYNAPYFDVFGVMGGYNTSNRWVRNAMMRADHIHFSENGYRLMGNLIFNAIINDYIATMQCDRQRWQPVEQPIQTPEE